MKKTNILDWSLLALVLIGTITGCNRKSEIDQYPSIEKGVKIVIAIPLTDFGVNGAQAFPILLQAGEECKITAEVSDFGNHSLRVIPKRVACINPDLVKELDSSKISDAYIDKRHLGILPNINMVFQLYHDTW